MTRCLLTGASGFLGRYLSAQLLDENCELMTLGRRPVDGCASLCTDLAAAGSIHLPHSFDEVYHAAGAAHSVPRTPGEKELFFAVNRDGTRRLLDALERSGPPRSFVLISTVAVYGIEEGENLQEDTPRTAGEAYGASKRAAEDLAADWCARNRIRLTIVRLPLIVGRAAPGNLRAMVAAMQSGRYLGIGSGRARRSMVWAGDVSAAIRRMAATGGTYHLTDGCHPSFGEIEERLSAALARNCPRRLPYWLAWPAALVCDGLERIANRRLPFDSRVLRKMTSSLTFSDQAARRELGWNPSPALHHIDELADREGALA